MVTASTHKALTMRAPDTPAIEPIITAIISEVESDEEKKGEGGEGGPVEGEGI